jgi:hypothetical protein
MLATGTWLAAQLPAGPDHQRVGVERRQVKDKGKKKRTEEEEEPPRTKKVVRTEDDDTAKTPSTRPGASPVTDLKQAARETRHPGAKRMFRELAVPHDIIVLTTSKRVTVGGGERRGGGELRVEPIAEYVTDPRDLKKRPTLQVIDEAGERLRTESPSPESIKSIRYYEHIVQDAVRDFLEAHYEKFGPKNAKHLGVYDQLVAAEQALAAAVRFHESAIDREVRQGSAWKPVERELRDKLLGVMLDRLKDLTEARQWDEAFALTTRLAETFKSREHLSKISVPLSELLKAALNDPTSNDEKRREVRAHLRRVEELFPGSDAVRRSKESLMGQAQKLLDHAKELIKEKKNVEALKLLTQAEEIWPQLPGLRALRISLDKSHQVLRVAVRELPEYLSPGWAMTDSELQAVELQFESLVKLSSRKGTMLYRPGLAEGRPRIVELGREFQLPRNSFWSDGKTELGYTDVRHTLGLLEKGEGVGRSAVWSELLGTRTLRVGGDPSRVQVRLRQGYIDPLGMMAFKILPDRRDLDVTSKRFARKPLGSGPFRFEGRNSEPPRNREYAGFTANPHYGARPSKAGLPRIREVRFYAPKDPVEEMRTHQIDMALDLTAEQAVAMQKLGKIEVSLPGKDTVNRRVYFLAVNHRKRALSIPEVRVALARAIHRERLLDDHYRGELKGKIHKALNGPYPAHTWACNPALHSRKDKTSLDPYDPDLARIKFKQAVARHGLGEVQLTLKYPRMASGDARLEQAMKELCQQVSKTLGITLNAEEVVARKLREDVEVTNSYDLAYYHYDFPDEAFWLMPILGANGPKGGENYLGYNGSLVGKVQTLTTLRNFTQVREAAHALHRDMLEQEMPIIPLWQLDPLVAYRNAEDNRVEVVPFDPLLVFTDIDQWRVVREGK